MIAAILGFMPALDRRLNIAIKSGTAAKVVPKPATMPTISDRLNSENRMLWGSLGTNSLQAHREIVLQRRPQSAILLNRYIKSTPAKRVRSLHQARLGALSRKV